MKTTPDTAPSQLPTKFERSSFLRAPDWRWQQARIYNNATAMNMGRPQPDDVKVVFAARIQKAFKDPARRQFLELKMPDVWQVCLLGTGSINAPMRCQLEACLIGNLTPQKIHKKLGWVSQTQVKLYRDFFFDLSGIQGVSGWFEQMLLSPIRTQNANLLFRARAIAHYHSVDVAIKSMRFGTSSKQVSGIIRQMWRDERNKRVFDYMAKNLNVPAQVYAGLMQQTIKSIQDRDFAIQMKGQQKQDSVTLEIASIIQKGIRGFTQKQIQESGQKQSDTDIAKIYMQNISQEPKVQSHEQSTQD